MAGLASGAQGGIGNRTMDRMLGTRNLFVPRNNRIAVFGPSHAANHFSQSTDGTGAGSLPSGSAQGPVNWANFLSGGRAVLEAADGFGYNGDWTDAMTVSGVSYPGMLSRVDAVIASGAGHIVMTAASANDRNSWTAAQSLANLDTIIGKISAAGILLTILLDYPHGDSVNTSYSMANIAGNPQLDYWQAVNRSLWSRHGQNGVRVVDVPALLGDQTSGFGRAITGATVEGLHLTQIGAFTIGRVLAREWRRIYPAIGVLPFGNAEKINQTGANAKPLLSVNPYFGGTGGTLGAGGSGALADSWTGGATAGLSATFSKVTTTAFAGTSYVDQEGRLSKDWQQIVLGGTATANGEVLLLRQSVTCGAGDVLRAAAEIEVDAGVTGLAGFEIYCWQAAGNPPAYSAARQFAMPDAIATMVWPNYAITGVLRTPRWTNETTQFNLCLAVRPIVGATVAGTIRLRGFGAGKGLA